MEIWKDIPGYEGLYQASTMGRVKSFYKRGKILKPQLNGVGYYQVSLHKDKKYSILAIHQLVGITFLGHKIKRYKLVINHKDFNKLNNNVENLEIVTSRENTNHKHLKSSSKYTGVHWSKSDKLWVSRIYIDGKRKQLGCFKNEDEAGKAYEKAINELIKQLI